jgi:Permeases of the major facilitator superfamily
MYDWANSSFATTVLAAFFPVFFKTFWNHGVEPTVSTARLGLATGAGGLLVALLSPTLGAMADAGRAKKKFLAVFIVIGVLSTASFFLVPMGAWQWAFVLIVLAELGFSCGNLFYDSLLVNVAQKSEMDMVSSNGYATGYAGGGLLFALNVCMTWKPAWFGLANMADAVRVSFLTVAAWWLVFALPIMLFVQEGAKATGSLIAVIEDGFRRLKKTTEKISRRRTLWMFLVAYWLYIDGIYTVIFMATDFGLAIGLSSISLMLSILLVQIVALPSSIAFGKLAGRIGTEKAILCGIAIYVCICGAGAFLLQSSIDFMVIAAFVGIAQGGVQALSRSYFAKIVPADESAEYFGFLNLVGKFSAIVGPILVGAVAFWTHKSGVSSHLSSRIAMSSIIVLFITGGWLLFKAESARKTEEAASRG